MAKPGRPRPATSSGSRSRSHSSPSGSYSASGSRSPSRSRSRSKSLSSSSSPSESSRSRSPPPQRRSPPGAARRAHSPSPPPKRASPPRKVTPPVIESVVLHIDHLSRNVNEAHLKEIFSNFGEVVNVELSMDRNVNLPRGYGYVEFKKRTDAEKARLYMDAQRQKVSSPPKMISHAPKREAPPRDKMLSAPDKVVPPRPREHSPKASPDSPPDRRVDSPCKGVQSLQLCVVVKHHHGGGLLLQLEDSLPLLEGIGHLHVFHHEGYVAVHLGSVLHSLLEGVIRLLNPIANAKGVQGAPEEITSTTSPQPFPVRRPARSRSRSASPRSRGRPRPPRRGRSSSFSRSPSPRKVARRVSRSRSPRRPARGRSLTNSRSSSSASPKRAKP
ncbi:hypothetical protein HPP92_027055 [Vanilla planifolia]|uniref:RRM domain-containing protein n=1 Tax=Vanilla planifolia TaxID=51239 RepID=A0A835PBR1_VANPL|nr:hypothetical protein HPP92_027055 [Vanilla planifolia]